MSSPASILESLIGDKNVDDIEKTIILALEHAGDTSKGRRWYSPVGVCVRLCGWGVHLFSTSSVQGAIVCAGLYGLLDTLGFKGTIGFLIFMLRTLKPKPKENTENAGGQESIQVP